MKQTLKIGDTVKVINKKLVHWYSKKGIIKDIFSGEKYDWEVLFENQHRVALKESELQLIKPKSKKVKKECKHKSVIGQVSGDYFWGHCQKCKNPVGFFIATQPKPIKEESKPFTSHYCIDCHGTGQNKKGDRCKNYDAWLKDHTKNMAEESKDIECPASSQFATDDVYLWAIRITDTINSLTKRNIK